MKKPRVEIRDYTTFYELFSEYLVHKHVELESGECYSVIDSDFTRKRVDLEHCTSKAISKVSHEKLIKGHFIWLKNNTECIGNASANTGFYQMAAWLKKQGDDAFNEQNCLSERGKSVKKHGRKLKHKSKLLKKSPELDKETPRKSLIRQRETHDSNISKFSCATNHFELHSKKYVPFRFLAQIVKLFAAFGVKLEPKTIKKIANEGVVRIGAPSWMDKNAEIALMQWALDLSDIGYLITRKKVVHQAIRMSKHREKRNLSCNWYYGWFNRCKKTNPELAEKWGKTVKDATFNAYNSPNINFYFDKVKFELLRLEVAEEADDSRELRWKYPENVGFFDETGLGEYKAKTSALGRKVICRQSGTPIGKTGDECSEHVTMVAGHTLTGSILPLIFVYKMSNPKDNTLTTTQNKLNNILKEYDAKEMKPCLGYNNNKQEDFIWGYSPKASVQKSNLQNLLTKMVDVKYPNCGDSPENRVILFTDWHSSRLDSKFLAKMREKGVFLFGWIPNTTSVSQPCDIAVFGPFKNKYRSLVKNQEKKLNKFEVTEYACKAYAEVAANKRIIFDGLTQAGMLPFTRQVHLESDLCKKGDEIRKQTEKSIAYSVTESFQDAETTYTSISQRDLANGLELDEYASWIDKVDSFDQISAKRMEVLENTREHKDRLQNSREYAKTGAEEKSEQAKAAYEQAKHEFEEAMREAEKKKQEAEKKKATL